MLLSAHSHLLGLARQLVASYRQADGEEIIRRATFTILPFLRQGTALRSNDAGKKQFWAHPLNYVHVSDQSEIASQMVGVQPCTASIDTRTTCTLINSKQIK
jgi:hypothetical protein